MTVEQNQTANGVTVRVTLLPKTFMEKVVYFFKTQYHKVKSIKFTKKHFKLWEFRMIASLAYTVKGVVGLLTLNFFDPDITFTPTHLIATIQSDIECDEFDKKLKEDVDGELSKEVPEYIKDRIETRAEKQKILDKMAREAEEEWYNS